MHRIKHKPKKKKGQRKMDNPTQAQPPKDQPQEKKLPPGQMAISQADRVIVEGLLQSKTGKGLVQVLEPMARRDLEPKNLGVTYNPKGQTLDITIALIEVNTHLWMNLAQFMWLHRMTWRWDGNGPQNMLVVRWFLPYGFPLELDAVKFPQPPQMEAGKFVEKLKSQLAEKEKLAATVESGIDKLIPNEITPEGLVAESPDKFPEPPPAPPIQPPLIERQEGK